MYNGQSTDEVVPWFDEETLRHADAKRRTEIATDTADFLERDGTSTDDAMSVSKVAQRLIATPLAPKPNADDTTSLIAGWHRLGTALTKKLSKKTEE